MRTTNLLIEFVALLLLLPVTFLASGCGGSYHVVPDSRATGRWTIALEEFAKRTTNREADILLRSGRGLHGTILAARGDTVYVSESGAMRSLAVPTVRSVSISSGIPVGLLSIPGGLLAGTLFGGVLVSALDRDHPWAALGGVLGGAVIGTLAGIAAAVFGSSDTVYEFTDQAIVQGQPSRER